MSSINIRPGVGILALFPAMNYKAWYALAELVDNALDSYITHKIALRRAEGTSFHLRIVIEVEGGDGGFIRVWDNAAGIDTANYERAFVTAASSVSGTTLRGLTPQTTSGRSSRRSRLRLRRGCPSSASA